MNKYKSIKFWYQKDDPFYAKLVEEIRLAHNKGYSPVEIARVMGQSAKNIYAMMRDEGIIAKMVRKRQKVYNLPLLLEKVLRKCGVSYLQWCLCHGLDPDLTVAALFSPEDSCDPCSVAAHHALRQDFPRAYAKILDPKVEYSTTWQPLLPELRTDYTITIRLNPENNLYTAFVHELPACRVEGESRDIAYFGLKSRYVCLAAISKLQLLPLRN